ncbi:MAG TPA: hypothetical protein VIQ54_30145 [Polyangia bacterium]|jgi:hypothetical protein
MRAGAALLFAAVLGAGACGGGKGAGAKGGQGGGGGSIGIGGTGGGIDGGLVGCLDQPGSLDRPPSDRLPCDLIPPGLRL